MCLKVAETSRNEENAAYFLLCITMMKNISELHFLPCVQIFSNKSSKPF